MGHKIHMGDDGILYLSFIGDVGKEDWNAYLNAIQLYLNNATAERPVHFLVDSSQLDKISASARRSLIDSFRNTDPRVGKTALMGTSPYARVLTGFVLKATGRKDIRFFATEEEALAWLRGETDEG